MQVFTRKRDPKGNVRGGRAGSYDGMSDKFGPGKKGRKDMLSSRKSNDDVGKYSFSHNINIKF